MATQRLILARRDAACGKVFHSDRRSAHEHRIALEIWYRATGRYREDCRFVVVHCKRCGGFHLGQKRIDNLANHNNLGAHNSSNSANYDVNHELAV